MKFSFSNQPSKVYPSLSTLGSLRICPCSISIDSMVVPPFELKVIVTILGVHATISSTKNPKIIVKIAFFLIMFKSSPYKSGTMMTSGG